MRLSPTLALVLALPSLTFAGGKACRVGRPEFTTPGLADLIDRTGVSDHQAPKELRLTDAQVDRLYDIHEDLDQARREALESIKDLRIPKKVGVRAAKQEALPQLVTSALLATTRDVSWLIEPDKSGLFHWARKANIEAHARGEKVEYCEVCAAVRSAVEAPFEFTAADFSVPVPAEREAQVREVAATLEGLRVKWAGVLAHELTSEQLSYVRGRQEEWLDRALALAVESAMRVAGVETCESCSGQAYAPKCGFCDTVKTAIAEARKPGKNAR